MCGIVGYVGRGPAPEILKAMLAAVAHRGPDGEGAWSGTAGDWSVALGHRRLAIIDIAGGAQPMASGDFHLTYNGEVYNFTALRQALSGVSFRTKSDSEVVLEHFRRHDAAGLAALNGMFAFAIWDGARLILARDRAGIKPLYYAALPDGGIAFASELTAVLLASAPRALSPAGVASYFFSDYVQAPFSIVEGIRKLPPGHFLVWQNGILSDSQPFWTVPEKRGVPNGDLWQALGDATERHLVADVPVGVFLSGGLDSSAVAAAAAARVGHRLKAFSIGFSDPTFDETEHAECVAKAIGVEHIVERLDEKNLIDVVDAALASLDEPLADPSILPTYLLSRLAAQHVKVVLSGDGGDELFGGYPTYRAHLLAEYYRRLPLLLRSGIARATDWLPVSDRYQSFEWALRRFTQRWEDQPTQRHFRWLSSLDSGELAKAVRGPAPKVFERASGDLVADMMITDFVTYLPGSVLAKVDRASMAHGLEARPPLLDNAIVDWALSAPSRFFFHGLSGKQPLKRAAIGHLPSRIIWRKKKGFGIPLARWLRGPLRERLHEVIERSPLWQTGLVDQKAFAGYEREHMQRHADHAKPLWALLVFDRWLLRHRQWISS